MENLLPLRLLMRTNLFIPSHFWTTCTKFDNCCQRYVTSRGKIYISAHLHSRPCTTAVESSSNLSATSIYTKWCAQTFPLIFGLFAIFDRNFTKIVAPPGNKNKNYVVHLKEQSILKKRWKQHHNRPINPHTIFVWTMSPTRRQDQAWHTKKTQIFALTAGARSLISPKLCMVIEYVVTILEVVNHFRSNA